MELVPEGKRHSLRFYLEDFVFETSSGESIISKSESEPKVAKSGFWASFARAQSAPEVGFFSDSREKVYLEALPSSAPKWFSAEKVSDRAKPFPEASLSKLASHNRITRPLNFPGADFQKSAQSAELRKKEGIPLGNAGSEMPATPEARPSEQPRFALGDLLARAEFSERLVEALVKALSNREVPARELAALSRAERAGMLVYLNKRCIVPDSALDSLGKYLDSPGEVCRVLRGRAPNSNCNGAGLAETIINRVVRFCFEDWIKTTDLEVFNGQFKFGRTRVSNGEINRRFWEALVGGRRGCKESARKFEKMFLKISSSVQIKKKKIAKKKRLKNVSIKQPKYLNIFLKKQLKLSILRRVRGRAGFRRFFDAYKAEVVGQYGGAAARGANCKFSFQLKSQVRKALGQIFRWFAQKGAGLGPVSAKALKVRLKHVACPVTLRDYLDVFEAIEKSL